MKGNGGFRGGSENTRIEMHPTAESICNACFLKDCEKGCKEGLNGAYN